MVLPGKITVKGGACATRRARAPRAPFTVVLRGERMPGTEDGPGPDFAGAAIGAALRQVPPTCGKQGCRPGGGGAPVGLPPEGARHGRRPGVGQKPRRFRLVLVVVPVSFTHSRSMASPFLLASGQLSQHVGTAVGIAVWLGTARSAGHRQPGRLTTSAVSDRTPPARHFPQLVQRSFVHVSRTLRAWLRPIGLASRRCALAAVSM